VPGRANRRLAPLVDRVFVQWDETERRFNRARMVRCVGCPIRPAFAQAKKEDAWRALKLHPDKKTLLITGASQGARSINAAVMALMDLWRVAKEWQIVHLTGAADLESCRGQYKDNHIDARTLAYTEFMPLCMAAADLVISRAGASTLAEITAMGVPSVLMPYPHDRKKHQLANAMVLVNNFAAELVEDKDDGEDNARRLRDILRDVMKSDERRRRMAKAAGAMGRTDAAQAIAEELFEMARRSG
jgi:UDP-N-acetylglucosamine--N-acetylmuramyl-(pentapeptide) pyrophosphoryl-undecaprenol N-acetylglucosamine transferase